VQLAPVFFTAITCTEAFWDAVRGASEASSCALSHPAGKPLGTPTAGLLDDAELGRAAALLLATAELGGAELEESELDGALLPAAVAVAVAVAVELGAATVEVPVVTPAAAGFDGLEEQAVAVSATRAPPARNVARCSRFMAK